MTMANNFKKGLSVLGLTVLLFVSGSNASKMNVGPLQQSLLPELNNWAETEDALTFLPESLFEYIDGAAEIYLAYDFQKLTVAQYAEKGSSATMSVEIYEMSNGETAFGIYSAERFPDYTFVPIGTQGYREEGTLNCLAGKFYVKLMCFDGGDRSEDYLDLFAGAIAGNVPDPAGFPAMLSHFAQNGLVANSEKFILKNVLGYSFLHDGYFAHYQIDDFEFDCFIIEGQNDEDANAMMRGYLEAKKSVPEGGLDAVVTFKDRYYGTIMLERTGPHICGVMKIKEGSEKKGLEYLEALVDSFGRRDSLIADIGQKVFKFPYQKADNL